GSVALTGSQPLSAVPVSGPVSGGVPSPEVPGGAARCVGGVADCKSATPGSNPGGASFPLTRPQTASTPFRIRVSSAVAKVLHFRLPALKLVNRPGIPTLVPHSSQVADLWRAYRRRTAVGVRCHRLPANRPRRRPSRHVPARE